MKVVFLALFALSSGSRRVFDGGTRERCDPYIIRDASGSYPLHLTDRQPSNSSSASVLAPELCVPPGWTMTLDVQERRKVFKPNKYDVFVSGYNGTQHDPVLIGLVNSIRNLSPFTSHQDFKDAMGTPISRMHWSVRPNRETYARAYIAKPRERRRGSYYTFEKLNKWAVRNQGISTNYGTQMREETFSVYHGTCGKKGNSKCGGLALTAIGHFKGYSFNFFLPGSNERVAYMSMVDRRRGTMVAGPYVSAALSKDRFRLTVLPGADVLMLTQLVAFIDHCNNFEELVANSGAR